jgi:hypothetical protein
MRDFETWCLLYPHIHLIPGIQQRTVHALSVRPKIRPPTLSLGLAEAAAAYP